MIPVSATSMTGSKIDGLTYPYTGIQPCSRYYAHGHTFRWVKDDHFIAGMKGICTESRRVIILVDHFEGLAVFEGQPPLVDLIPAPSGDWADDRLLRRLADDWAEHHTHHTQGGAA